MSSIQGIQHNSNLSSESGAANILNTRVSLGQQMYKYFSGCQCVALCCSFVSEALLLAKQTENSSTAIYHSKEQDCQFSSSSRT